MDTYFNGTNTQKQFSKGSFKRPGNYDKKGLNWFKKMSKHIYAQYCSNSGVVGYGGMLAGRSIRELRLYARGEQPIEKYINIIDNPINKQGKKEVYANISWENHKLLPKFLDIIMAKFEEQKFGAITHANDFKASKERTERYKIEKMLRNPAVQEFSKNVGVTPKQKTAFPDIKSDRDLEMLVKMGGISLDHEIIMKDVLDSVLYNSEFSQIERMLKRDAIEIGIYADEDYIEKSTGIVKKKYVDPALLVARSSKYEDCRDIDYAGYIESKTIFQLRQESDLSEEILYTIARKYRKHGVNAGYEHGFNDTLESLQRYFDKNGHFPHDDYKVDVLKYYVVSGRVGDFDTGIDSPPQRDTNTIHSVYRCHYILGTEFVYDYGEEYGIVRQGAKGAKRVELPIKIWKSSKPAFVERCISFVDDIQLAILKKRNFLRKLPPGPRLFLDKSILKKKVKLGNREYDMFEMTELFMKTGIFVYESISEYAEYGSARKPIEDSNINIYQDYELYTREILSSVDMIRQVTGINPVTDGTSTNEDMLKSVQEGLMSASNSALKPTFDDFRLFLERDLRYTNKKFQLSVLNGDIKIEFQPYLSKTIKTVNVTKQIADYDYGIHLMLLPTGLQKQEMMMSLNQKELNDQISVADAFFAKSLIEQNDYKKFQIFIAEAVERREKEKHQMAMQVQAAQGDANAKAAVTTEEEKRKTINLEKQWDLKIQQEKNKGMLEQKRLEAEGKIAQTSTKIREETGKSLIEKQADKELFDEKRAAPVASESNDGL